MLLADFANHFRVFHAFKGNLQIYKYGYFPKLDKVEEAVDENKKFERQNKINPLAHWT